ncbi:uncharacterized protein LOC129891847 [Solanum dulcamara]|uniref:uncharacterized protein LOC129891847 n=1 Tax=Solanum dulcamara TaxID=45834 RepID=UPI0024864DC7|nr:uncharacterized protein LOC129891847 [Solanum dulcamara]
MNRPSMAKARVGIDLLKPLVHNVWVGTEDDNTPLRDFSQKIEYENIPKFCKHCKKLGHNMINCRVLEKINETEKKEALQKDQQGTNQQHPRNLEQDNRETKLPEEAETTPNRGREMQNKRETNTEKTRGRSEPPRKAYKPTGIIFWLDKPHPTSTTEVQTNVEITKINNKNKANNQTISQLMSFKCKSDMVNSDTSPASKEKTWNMRSLLLNRSMEQAVKRKRLSLRII